MSEAWFSPDVARLFSLLSLLSLLALAERFARQGRHRGYVMGAWNAAMAFACVLLAVAGLAYGVGQPAHVTRAFALSGFMLAVVFAHSRRGMTKLYTNAELRRSVADDL
jgi:hypothetical protein